MSVQIFPSGVQLLKSLCAQGRTFHSGLPDLDRLLGGGLNSGQVMEVIGSSTTGKTHICHAMAAHVAASHPPVLGHRVLYIDCAGHFSVARLLTFVERECQMEKQASDSEEFHVAQTMRRISVVRCIGLDELVRGFEEITVKIRESLKHSQRQSLSASLPTVTSKAENLPELIIIDSLASAFSVMPLSAVPNDKESNKNAGDESAKRNRAILEKLIAQFSLLVRQVAVSANLAVVVTNPIPVPQMLFSGSYFNAWTCAPHIRLLLDLAPPSNKSSENTKETKTTGNSKLRRFATLRHHSGSRYTATELTHADQPIQFSTSFILP